MEWFEQGALWCACDCGLAGRRSHAAQFDEVLENGVFGTNDNGKSKYGSLSTTAARCAAFGRDDGFLWRVWRRTSKGKGKSAEWRVYIPPFAKCMRRMGHPSVCGGFRTTGNDNSKGEIRGFFVAFRMTEFWCGRGREQATATATTTAKAKANTGVSPLRGQGAPPPVEMTAFVVGEERERTSNSKSEIRGFFAALRMTEFWDGRGREQATATTTTKAKTKYGVLRLALRASLRMAKVLGGFSAS